MNKIIAIIFVACIFQRCYANNYKIGDTLRVITMNGLNLRIAANQNASRIVKLEFGNEIITESLSLRPDTIDSRPGNWLKVKTLDNKVGFVFDAFLTKMPIPSSEQVENSDFLSYLIHNYPKSSCELKVETPSMSEKSLTSEIIYKLGNDITVVDITGWEWQNTEVIIRNIRYGELITFAELFYSKHIYSKQNFNSELKKEFKMDMNKLKIQINDDNLILILSNGVESKSIIISEILS